MAYQALLFCPDEKTARTVTQVLSELDFEVMPCTEPFAAVKKLMAEHFDAVVVDCDNEQNATLLFKSARNAPKNHSALAVAVVEGQAGVAKAFRIGANLVLTRPINVEQAKGTLRVARGLLRKNESPKPAATTAHAAPSAEVPAATPAKAPAISNIVPTRPVAPLTMAGIATAKPAAGEAPESSISKLNTQEEEPHQTVSAAATQPSSPEITPSVATTARSPISFAKPEPIKPAATGLSTSAAASAPAPALEPKPEAQVPDKTSTASSQQASSEERVEAIGTSEGSAAAAPSLTFGGTVASASEPSRENKKILLAAAAIVLVASAGYAAWTQFGHSNGTPAAPVSAAPNSAAPRPVANPAAPAVALATPGMTPTPTTGLAKSTESSPAITIPDPNANSQMTGSTKASRTGPATDDASSKPVANSKPSSPDSSKAVSPTAAAKAPETAQPLIVKSGTTKAGASRLQTVDTAAPSIGNIETAENGGALPNLMENSSQATVPVLQTVSISQGVSQGLVIKKISPSYPPTALRLRIEGPVELLATISKKGDISAVKVVSGDPNLTRAAVDAVKQWKYQPYLLDGAPVEIQTQVTINFKLPR
jgi:TonB family protein